MILFLIFLIFIFGCKSDKSSTSPVNQLKYAIAGTILSIPPLSDTLAGVLIRIKNLTDNVYISDANVKVNNVQITYNSGAFGYSSILKYNKNQNYHVDISFQNYIISLDCYSNNLDSVKVYLSKDSVIRGEIVNVSWTYYGEPSGNNMILLRKAGYTEFYFASNYISVLDTFYSLNISNADIGDYDLLLISGSFCIINNFEPYPPFQNSFIFVGRGSSRILKIR